MQNINDLRNLIDEIDDELVKTLDRRLEIVKKIGELKLSKGGAIYRPERESSIISRLDSLKPKNLRH